jgi:Protein of unknown function with HXXEE motif
MKKHFAMKTKTNSSKPMHFKQTQWLFPVAVTFHNLEEAIWLPQWSQTAGEWHAPVGAGEFRFAVIILTLFAYLATYISFKKGKESFGVYLLSGYASAMFLNVFFPHLLGSLLMKAYVPGLTTALVLNLPVTLILLRQAFHEGYISAKRFILATIMVTVGLLASIPFLFSLGRYFY